MVKDLQNAFKKAIKRVKVMEQYSEAEAMVASLRGYINIVYNDIVN